MPGSGVLTFTSRTGRTFKLRDAVRLMIAFSDNTATNLVLDAIGIGATAATMEKLGYPNTKIHSKVFRRDTSVFPERSKQFGLGSTTADEMIRLCEAVYRKQLVSPEACEEMLAHLRACEDKDKFPRLLAAGNKVAFKTGSLAETRTAAGIIEWPDGPGRPLRPLCENDDKRWVADNAGNRLCAEIARAVLRPFRSSCTARAQHAEREDGSTQAALTPARAHRQDLGQGLRLSLAVDARQRRVALGQEHAVAQHLVTVHDLDVRDPRHGRPDRQQVVVVRGPLELAADVDDHQEMAAVLDLAIRDPALAEHLGPGHLEVDEVVRVVQEPHAVGLGVADADGDFVAVVHDRLCALHLTLGSSSSTVRLPAAAYRAALAGPGDHDQRIGVVRPLFATGQPGLESLVDPAAEVGRVVLEPLLGGSQLSY